MLDERLKFIAGLLQGEKMAVLCREYGISRKTGYKLYTRYKDCGLEGLSDRSRRPYRYANQLPYQVERAILGIKKEHRSWSALKIRAKLLSRYPSIYPPSKRTIHAVLDRHGLVKRRGRKRNKAQGTSLSCAQSTNALWCVDYKGEFQLGNKAYCYPLTITDYHSRYLLACEGLSTTKMDYAFTVFERVFKAYGLPCAIRSDNGLPFSAPTGLFGLSRLSVWWLRLGIGIERIAPGKPQQNGRHERLHLTLKQEATQPAGYNFLQQQAKFDKFIEVYNYERPHQGLAMQYPGQVYTPSTRIYEGLPEVEYPFHDRTVEVTRCGRICYRKKKIHISQSLSGQKLGIREVEDKAWLVSFMQYDIGYFDEQSARFEMYS